MPDVNRVGRARGAAPLVAFAACTAAAWAPPARAGQSERVVLEAVGDSRRAVVAEGDFEPRSLGSYSIRVYDPVDPQFPYERYLAGHVMPRQGTVEAIRSEDLNGDGRAELVVVVRSVGTGGFVHADAFKESSGTLQLVATAHGLPKDADVSRALRSKLGGTRTPRD